MNRAASRETGAQPAYLTTGQAARLLGVAKNTLLRAVRLGEIRVARQMPGGALRFLPADVEAYARSLTARGQGRTEPAPRADTAPARPGAAVPDYAPGGLRAGAPEQPVGEQAGGVEPAIHTVFERLAQVTASAESGFDGLVSDVLAMLADSLHVGLSFLARAEGAEGAVWRMDWVHDRVGMGLAPGTPMPLWETCREALLAGAGATLIVDDVQTDARFSSATAARRRGLGSYTGVPLHHADGRLFGALCTLHPRARTVPDGEIALLRLAGRIIVQAVEAEALRQSEHRLVRQLAASEEHYRRIVEMAREGILALDPDGAITYLNQRMAAMLGYTVGEMLGAPIFSYIDEAEQAAAQAAYAQRRQRLAETRQFDARLRHKDGGAVWVLACTVALTDEGGAFVGEFAMLTDITERKQVEERLRESEEQYRRIVETAQEGIVQSDADNVITFVNQRLAEMLGHQVEDLIGQPLLVLVAEDARGVVAANQQRRREGYRDKYLHDLKLRAKDGAERWVMVSTSPTFDAEGRFTGGTSLLLDISERVRAERERAEVLAREAVLREEVSLAHEAARVKNELLRTVSHELRTPLAAIKGFASGLLAFGSALDEAQMMEALQAIDTSSDRLSELIENLLFMQRLGSGQLDVRRRPVDLAALIQQVVAELRPSMAVHTLTVQGPEELPLVQGDPRRLHQIVANLLGNAIKYSPGGGRIDVALAERADAETGIGTDTETGVDTGMESSTGLITGSGWVELRVKDEGLGLAADQLERIFEPFQRVETAATRGIYGTGLGLSIVKSLVEAHAGRVWAESAGLGRGSTFVVALPIAEQASMM